MPEWRYSAPGFHSYPPRKDRWAAPERLCSHCGLPSCTTDRLCPVCAAPFQPRALRRLIRRARRGRRAPA